MKNIVYLLLVNHPVYVFIIAIRTDEDNLLHSMQDPELDKRVRHTPGDSEKQYSRVAKTLDSGVRHMIFRAA